MVFRNFFKTKFVKISFSFCNKWKHFCGILLETIMLLRMVSNLYISLGWISSSKKGSLCWMKNLIFISKSVGCDWGKQWESSSREESPGCSDFSDWENEWSIFFSNICLILEYLFFCFFGFRAEKVIFLFVFFDWPISEVKCWSPL